MNRLLIILCLCLAACSCAEQQPPIPRPRAYPRPALYSAEYQSLALSGNPGVIAVNRAASVEVVKPGWFNINYPAYDISVNCTLTPISAETLAATLNNRRERMARNLQGEYGEVLQWDGSTVIVAPGALRTPVQFLATDSASYVLSGVAVGNYPADTAADSIAPFVDAVANDIIHMLKQL